MDNDNLYYCISNTHVAILFVQYTFPTNLQCLRILLYSYIASYNNILSNYDYNVCVTRDLK